MFRMFKTDTLGGGFRLVRKDVLNAGMKVTYAEIYLYFVS